MIPSRRRGVMIALPTRLLQLLCVAPEYLRRARGIRRQAGTSVSAACAVAEVAACSADIFCLGIMLARIFAAGARPFNTDEEVCGETEVFSLVVSILLWQSTCCVFGLGVVLL